MMIRLSTEVSMEGERGRPLISNEVKAKEAITSWEKRRFVSKCGSPSGKLIPKPPSFGSFKAQLVIILLIAAKRSLIRGSALSVVSHSLCPSRLTQFTVYLAPPDFKNLKKNVFSAPHYDSKRHTPT